MDAPLGTEGAATAEPGVAQCCGLAQAAGAGAPKHPARSGRRAQRKTWKAMDQVGGMLLAGLPCHSLMRHHSAHAPQDNILFMCRRHAWVGYLLFFTPLQIPVRKKYLFSGYLSVSIANIARNLRVCGAEYLIIL